MTPLPRRNPLGLALAAVLFVPAPSRADFGPKPDDGRYFTVTREGRPLPRFTAALVCQSGKLKDRPDNRGVAVPGLARLLPPDSTGLGWTYADYKWGGEGADSSVKFHGFYGNVPPGRIRLVVYLPDEDKLFLSNEADTHPFLNRYRADLSEDGTATLTRVETGRWLADALLGLSQRGILVALAVTVAVELGVVCLAAVVLGRRQWLRRAAGLSVTLNVLTLPAVWVVSLVAFFLAGLWFGLLVLAALELVVTLAEGVVYATLGGLGWARGLGTALLANAASGSLGLVYGFLSAG